VNEGIGLGTSGVGLITLWRERCSILNACHMSGCLRCLKP
jgi:hypothetical protein